MVSRGTLQVLVARYYAADKLLYRWNEAIRVKRIRRKLVSAVAGKHQLILDIMFVLDDHL